MTAACSVGANCHGRRMRWSHGGITTLHHAPPCRGGRGSVIVDWEREEQMMSQAVEVRGAYNQRLPSWGYGTEGLTMPHPAGHMGTGRSEVWVDRPHLHGGEPVSHQCACSCLPASPQPSSSSSSPSSPPPPPSPPPPTTKRRHQHHHVLGAIEGYLPYC